MVSSPLESKRVVVTRPAAQADSLCYMLKEAGAVPIRFPTICIRPVEKSQRLEGALAHLENYDWVVFTSVNGVRYALNGLARTWPDSTLVAAIGPATKRALVSRGVPVHFMPSEYRAECIAEGIGGHQVLMLRAQGARPALRTILQSRGTAVEEIPLYFAETIQPPQAAYSKVQQGVDAITFTSASTVRSYAELMGADVKCAVIACIGPVTADMATSLGMPVHAVAAEYTISGMVEALKEFYAAR